MSGWVCLHRKIQENNLWTSEKFTRGQAWVDLLLLANRKDGYIMRRGIRVNLSRGDVGHSYEFLAKRWRWSKGKVIRFINFLISEKMVLKNDSGVGSVNTRLHIINYKQYQDTVPKMEPKTEPKTGMEQQRKQETTIVERENGIDYAEIVSYLNSKTNSNYKPTTRKTRDLIKARHKEGFVVDDFKRVIDIKSSKWLNDQKMSAFLRPETLFGNKFESYLNEKQQSSEWY